MSETVTLGDEYSVEFDAFDLREALEDADPDEDGNIGGRSGQSGNVTVVGDGYNDDDLLVSNGSDAKFSSVSDVREALDEQETFVTYLEDELGHLHGEKLQTDGLRFPKEVDLEYKHVGSLGSATIGRSRGQSLDEDDGVRISYIEATSEADGLVIHVGLEDVRDD